MTIILETLDAWGLWSDKLTVSSVIEYELSRHGLTEAPFLRWTYVPNDTSWLENFKSVLTDCINTELDFVVLDGPRTTVTFVNEDGTTEEYELGVPADEYPKLQELLIKLKEEVSVYEKGIFAKEELEEE